MVSKTWNGELFDTLLKQEGAEGTYLYFRITEIFFKQFYTVKTRNVKNKATIMGFFISNEIMSALFLFFMFVNSIKILQARNDRCPGDIKCLAGAQDGDTNPT